jgi:hemolysin D
MNAAAARFPSLTHHWTVLREAWRNENEARRGRQRTIAEHEFLPAALEIMEKPPSPGLRILMLLLCGLFTLALLWSFVGRVDVVAVATGRTLPIANVKLIQPIEIGVVRAIHVRNGQRVRRGQLLIELDPTTAAGQESQATQGLLAANVVRSRNAALLAHLQGRPAVFRAPPGTPADVAATQAELVRSKVAEYESERRTLIQNRAERAAELAGTSAEIAKLRQTLPLMERQLEARRELAGRGHFSQLRVLEYEQARIEHIQNIEVQEAAAARARAAIGTIDASLSTLRERFAEEAATELAGAENDSSVQAQELRMTARRRQLQQLVAPVDGIVQQLVVHTVGGVVQPAQPLMVVVPVDGEIAVDAQVLNRDIGFVREGQPVRVKLEAFPFTDYGIVEGVVETISRDAVPSEAQQSEQQNANARAAPTPSLVYGARIRLLRNYVTVAGRRQPIGPGMAVQAEIRTGRRRIIQYLLSPISQAIDEAGRER